MDIDEFLDRELSDLGSPIDAFPQQISGVKIIESTEQIEPSPLFENIKTSLGKGNLELAEQSYAQLWHLLIQQKLKWNKELYGQLSALSRQFSSTLSYSSAEVKKKADHINELINRARSALKEGKKELPFKIYSELQEINNSIPSMFFEEKRIIEQQITDFYKELKNTTDNELVKRVYFMIQEINQLIGKANASIRLNDMINAVVIYNKCIELYNQVPEGFLRHKNPAGMRLLEIYKGLSIYSEISSLQKQLRNGQVLESRQRPVKVQAPVFKQEIKQELKEQKAPIVIQTKSEESTASSKLKSADEEKEQAKKNIKKGFYNEAIKNIQEALKLDPNDVEAKALHAQIKTLQ